MMMSIFDSDTFPCSHFEYKQIIQTGTPKQRNRNQIKKTEKQMLFLKNLQLQVFTNGQSINYLCGFKAYAWQSGCPVFLNPWLDETVVLNRFIHVLS
jgi:hypothetical protein